MGGAGLVVCLVFVGLSAPDLALTQLLVEVVSLVLLMLALKWLPEESPLERGARWHQWRDAALALAVGLGVAALVWMVLTRPGHSISDFFFATALPLGGGANVVNVIIVDYRGFDTLGEITVLGIAGVALLFVVGRLGRRRRARHTRCSSGRRPSGSRGRPAGARGDHAADVPGDRDVPVYLLAARPQPAGRRIHRRPDARDRLVIVQYMAGRRALVRDAPRVVPRCDGPRSGSDRRRHGCGRLAVRPSVPHLHSLTSRCRCWATCRLAERLPVRHRRVRPACWARRSCCWSRWRARRCAIAGHGMVRRCHERTRPVRSPWACWPAPAPGCCCAAHVPGGHRATLLTTR